MAEQIMAKAEYLSSLHQRQISVLINKNRAQQDFTMPSATSANHFLFSILFLQAPRYAQSYPSHFRSAYII